MSKNVETIKNVIEDESHFVMKVIDNDLGALAMFEKHFMGEHRKGVVRSYRRKMWWKLWERKLHGQKRWRSSRESKSACGEVGGVEKMNSTGSKLMVRGKECLEACVGAGGGEVNGGRDDFGVSKSLLGEIPEVVIGESDGETFGDDRGAVW
ncbi:hypothetical protein Tco_0654195 [Tanacetum coccineum]|uniref:Uncharacterized protein n=1 Tax=Tanacetum coccineum TaxID=301880 RepID=A0ABQ4X2J1_9ASTR